MLPSLPSLLLATLSFFLLVIASPICSGTGVTAWISGAYGPNNQTTLTGEFPIQPGQSISVQVIVLATCKPPLAPLLVEFSVILMDVLSYEAIAPTAYSAGPAVVVGAPNPLPDPDDDETEDPDETEPPEDEDPNETEPPEDRRRAFDGEDPGDHLMGFVSATFAGGSNDDYVQARETTGFLWLLL